MGGGTRGRLDLLWRAVVVALLGVGFWLVLGGMLVGSLYLLVVSVQSDGSPGLVGSVATVTFAAILLCLRPRRRQFEAPGPQIQRSEEPELFAVIDEVVEATGSPGPHDVYVDGNMNAGVFARGGLLGLRARRGLLIGLPLCQLMSAQELKAVLAHEYAHYYGGDTALGGWMARTEHRANRIWEEMVEGVGITALPFGLYAALVTAVLDGVRRRQELAADRRAASSYGGSVLAGVLNALPGWSLAFREYLRRGAPRPDPGVGVLAGFGPFLDSPDVQQLARFGTFREMEATTRAGTHPPLRERIRQLRAIPDPPVLDGRPATAVIRNFEGLELRLFVHWSRAVQR